MAGEGEQYLVLFFPDHQLPSKSCLLFSGHTLPPASITGKQAPAEVTQSH